jgi:hypothetical protein
MAMISYLPAHTPGPTQAPHSSACWPYSRAAVRRTDTCAGSPPQAACYLLSARVCATLWECFELVRAARPTVAIRCPHPPLQYVRAAYRVHSLHSAVAVAVAGGGGILLCSAAFAEFVGP